MSASATTERKAPARKAPADHKAKGEGKAKGEAKAPAKRESALDKAIRLTGEATEAQSTLDSLPASATPAERQAAKDAADAAHAEAVLAWMPVPSDQTPAMARTYATDHGAVIMERLSRTAATVARREAIVSDARKSLDTARTMAARRTADVVAFVHGVIDEHGWLTAQGFVETYGVSKSQVSKWRAAGQIAAKLGTTSPTRVAALNSAVSHDMAGVRAATKAKGATFDTVITAARVKRGETTRAAAEAKAGESETPAREAHLLAVKLTRQLTHLNATGGTVADFTDPDVSGYSVVRALLSVLSAYVGRTVPGFDPVPVLPPTYAPGGTKVTAAAKGKRLPRPNASK